MKKTMIILSVMMCAFVVRDAFSMPLYKVEVIRVIDGDTVRVNVDMGYGIKKEDSLRLCGVNTPELKSKVARDKKRALEAKEHLKNRLLNAKRVLFAYIKQGKFGRPVGILIADGKNLNQEILDLKLGVPFMEDDCKEDYLP